MSTSRNNKRAKDSTYGRSTRKYKKMRERLKRQNLPCWICGQPIPDVPWPDPMSFSADHSVPRSVDLDVAEVFDLLKPSHLGCNSRRSNKEAPSERRTRDWFADPDPDDAA